MGFTIIYWPITTCKIGIGCRGKAVWMQINRSGQLLIFSIASEVYQRLLFLLANFLLEIKMK